MKPIIKLNKMHVFDYYMKRPTKTVTNVGLIIAVHEERRQVERFFPSIKRGDGIDEVDLRAPTGEKVHLYFYRSIANQGNLEAAVKASRLILSKHVSHIILVGTAGGISNGLQPPDVVVSGSLNYFERATFEKGKLLPRQFSVNPPSRNLVDRVELMVGTNDSILDNITKEYLNTGLQLDLKLGSGIMVKKGGILTGEKTINASNQNDLGRFIPSWKSRKNSDLKDYIAIEQEGAGIASACSTLSSPKRLIDYIIIKGISDKAVGGNKEERKKNFGLATINSLIVAHCLIRSIAAPQSNGCSNSDSEDIGEFFQRKLKDEKSGEFDYEEVLQKIFGTEGRSRIFMIKGEGGIGKTTMLKAIANAARTLTDFRVSSMELKGVDVASLDKLLSEINRQNKASGDRGIIILDGLDQVKSDCVNGMLDTAARYTSKNRQEIIIISDRMRRRKLPDGVSTFYMEKLGKEIIMSQFEAKCGESSWLESNSRMMDLLEIPFFLRTALELCKEYIISSNKAGMLKLYFEHVLSIDDLESNLEKLGKLTWGACYEAEFTDSLEKDRFRQSIGQGSDEILDRLTEAMVLKCEGLRLVFSHQYFQEFLATWHLARNSCLWTHKTFDRLTLNANSDSGIELLTEIVGTSIRQEGSIEDLIIKVYDWNWVETLSILVRVEPSASINNVRHAILATASLKLRDDMYYSREMTRIVLNRLPSQDVFIKGMIRTKGKLEAISGLVREVTPAQMQSDRTWFSKWYSAISANKRDIDEIIGMIGDKNSVLGWTAANVFRYLYSQSNKRGAEEIFATLNDMFDRCDDNSDHCESVRWRIVHALGAMYDTKSAREKLFVVYGSYDQTKWVRYGAVRSLMEHVGMIFSKGDAKSAGGILKNIEQARDQEIEPVIKKEMFHCVLNLGIPKDKRSKWISLAKRVIGFPYKQKIEKTEMTELVNNIAKYKKGMI